MKSYTFRDKRNPKKVRMTPEEFIAKMRKDRADWSTVFDENGKVVGWWEWSNHYPFRYSYEMCLIPEKYYVIISEEPRWYK